MTVLIRIKMDIILTQWAIQKNFINFNNVLKNNKAKSDHYLAFFVRQFDSFLLNRIKIIDSLFLNWSDQFTAWEIWVQVRLQNVPHVSV